MSLSTSLRYCCFFHRNRNHTRPWLRNGLNKYEVFFSSKFGALQRGQLSCTSIHWPSLLANRQHLSHPFSTTLDIGRSLFQAGATASAPVKPPRERVVSDLYALGSNHICTSNSRFRQQQEGEVPSLLLFRHLLPPFPIVAIHAIDRIYNGDTRSLREDVSTVQWTDKTKKDGCSLPMLLRRDPLVVLFVAVDSHPYLGRTLSLSLWAVNSISYVEEWCHTRAFLHH